MISRRRLLGFLPLLPALPKLIGSLGTGRLVYAESATTTPNFVLRSRQAYEILLNGGRRLVEDVEWATRNGETLPGSTLWRRVWGRR